MAPLPKFLHQRGTTYYVRRPVPPDVQAAFGKKEVWVSLRTTSRKEAEARSHAVLADLEGKIESERRRMNLAQQEEAFLASSEFEGALREYSKATAGMDSGGQPFARAWTSVAEAKAVSLGITTGFLRPRPTSRAEALGHIDHALSELEVEGAYASLVTGMDEDGGPIFGSIPDRFVPALMERLNEVMEAEKRTLEAQKAIIDATVVGTGTDTPQGKNTNSLTALSAIWVAQRKPARSSLADMRTAISRLEGLVGPLPYADITDEHARRFKADLIGDDKLKNATRGKLWGMLRALLNVAVDDGLLAGNPFTRVKLKLDDDSDPREVLNHDDLKAIFSKLPPEEWWIARIGLYTGARLGEICPLTKSDLVTVDGVLCLHIREDAAVGRSVKNRGSIRKVPVHRQLIADGLVDWVQSRPGDRIFSIDSAPASKRLNRHMRNAGLGAGKVFHSFRHTFKGVARRHMDDSWHDKLTGHAAKTVGQTYGDYDLRTLKEKIDLIGFGIQAACRSGHGAGC